MLKKVLICFLLTASFSIGQIKPVSYWTSPTMSQEEAKKLSKFSLVIADLDNIFNNLESLKTIKRLNPSLKLICYSNPMEIFDPLVSNRPRQNAWSEEIKFKYSDWLLETKSGKKAVFFPGMRMLNMSSSCKVINGQKYNEWMANLLVTEVLSVTDTVTGRRIWDGYFMDNCSPTMSWVSNEDLIDIGPENIPELIDKSWSEGNREFLSIIRQAMGKNFILIGNKGVTDYRDLLDGRMFEWFPNDYIGAKLDGGWWQSMANAAQTGPYTIFLVSPKDLDFGILSSQMLDNVYVGVGNNSLRWYKQFDQDLGEHGEIIILKKFSKKCILITPAEKSAEILED